MPKKWLHWTIGLLVIAATAAGEGWIPVPGEPPAIAVHEERVDPEAAGEGCAVLAGLEPVGLEVRRRGVAPAGAGLGYHDPETDRILVPVRRLITPFAPPPLGVYWDEATRTATLLREGSVLSIHFPEGRNRSSVAILNGEVEVAESVLCEGRLHAPLRLLVDGLGLRMFRRTDGSIIVEAR